MVKTTQMSDRSWFAIFCVIVYRSKSASLAREHRLQISDWLKSLTLLKPNYFGPTHYIKGRLAKSFVFSMTAVQSQCFFSNIYQKVTEKKTNFQMLPETTNFVVKVKLGRTISLLSCYSGNYLQSVWVCQIFERDKWKNKTK